jgi:oligopeptide/dipeptide ABC transporter ATP-binding protein
MVGVPDGAKRLGAYPKQFSGGQRQRIMIAMALALKPHLLIADEPTTALDVTIQSQILDLMLDLRKETGNTSILLITHDLAVVAETCERVAVMYGGKIQEIADVSGLFRQPLHPYTRGLLRSLPRPDRKKQRRLDTIPGIVPSILNFPPGCKFWSRCAEVVERCKTEEPELREIAPGRFCRCHLVDDDALAVPALEDLSKEDADDAPDQAPDDTKAAEDAGGTPPATDDEGADDAAPTDKVIVIVKPPEDEEAANG